MVKYNQQPNKIITINKKDIYCFQSGIKNENLDKKTVESFGEEWSKFANFNKQEISKIGDEYFDIVNSNHLNENSIVLDLGCGSGRWTKYLSPKVKFIEAVDPSDAVLSASQFLSENKNVRVSKSSVDNIPFQNNSFDFAFSLGVLHHIPNTEKALTKVVEKVKINGWVLIYLYYSLDNRGILYKFIFQISCIPRFFISKMPSKIKHILCEIIAFIVYVPLITLASILKGVFKNKFYTKIPLSYYVGKSLNVVRNDALDRFGTPLEQRFSKKEIKQMMENSGLGEIIFSNKQPFWHAIGKRIK
tara:strand:+ start:2361 stop:3269 length:909 start_codon:yes stop_codon:yes gene_type:complete